MNRFALLAVLALGALTPAPEARSGPWECMECFEVDLGDGWFMHGCQPTPSAGTDYCTITVKGCSHNAACSDGAVIIGPPIPPGWIGNHFGSPPPTPTQSLDAALEMRSAWALQFTVPWLIEYSSGIAGGAQPEGLRNLEVDFDGAVEFVRVTETATPAVYRVRWDGNELDVQQLLFGPLARASLIGFSMSRTAGSRAWLARPNGDSWDVRLVPLDPYRRKDGDGVGTLPAKDGDGVGSLPAKDGDGVGSLPFGDDVGSLPQYGDDVGTLPVERSMPGGAAEHP